MRISERSCWSADLRGAGTTPAPPPPSDHRGAVAVEGVVAGHGREGVVLRPEATVAGGFALLPVAVAQEGAELLAARSVVVPLDMHAALVPDRHLVAGLVAEIGLAVDRPASVRPVDHLALRIGVVVLDHPAP